MKKVFLLIVLFFQLNAFGQRDSSLVQLLRPSDKGFSQVAKIDLGNCYMLIVSGQLPLDKNGNLVGKGDLAKQTEQVFLNIQNCLAGEGGTMNDLIRLGVFITDIKQVQAFRAARDKFINLIKPPTSSLVEVNELVVPDIMIEVEATAIIVKR